jgi:hypothetical protein
MTYSTGPGGYGGPPQGPSTPGYGPPAPGYGAAAAPAPGYGAAAAPAPGEGKGLPFFLHIGVIALGVISFFAGFAPYISGSSAQFGGESISISASYNFFATNGVVSISLLLAAALVAALGMLPKQEINDGVVTSLSVVGFVSLLFQMIALPGEANIGLGLIIVLVTSFLQAALAIAALLFASGIVKPPQRSQQPQYGYYGQAGTYGQPPQQPAQPSPPQQPYYGGAPAQGAYPQSPPSQPQQPHNQW